jgi:hypothetical protein
LQKLLYPKKNRSQQTADHSEKSSQQTASKQGQRKRKSNKKERKKEKCKLGTHPRGGDAAGDARQSG